MPTSISRLLEPKRLVVALVGRLLCYGFGGLALSLFSANDVVAQPPVFESLSVLKPPTSGVAQEPYLAVAGNSLVMSWMVPTISETLGNWDSFLFDKSLELVCDSRMIFSAA